MHHITIQYALDKQTMPKATLLRKWAKTALDTQYKSAALTIRLVNVEEMSELNATYRNKKGPTNVLSFPAPKNIPLEIPLLGDIVIRAEVIKQEAKLQEKTEEAHWAHIVIHGVFHLLGYDHEKERDAHIMETLEIKTLQTLGFRNPYLIKDDHHDRR